LKRSTIAASPNSPEVNLVNQKDSVVKNIPEIRPGGFQSQTDSVEASVTATVDEDKPYFVPPEKKLT
jgi:hypothetical protein